MKKYFLVLFAVLSICLYFSDTTFSLSSDFFNESAQIGTWQGKISAARRMGHSGIGNFDYSRSTYGLKGNINNDIGVKWKQFIGGVSLNSSLTYGGADINGDGSHNFFYVKGGKGFLVDLATGNIVWETKSFGINKILGVEGVLGVNKKKQIVFTFGDNPYYVGILDGRTGTMISNSKIWGTLSNSWTYSPNFIRDEQFDGSVIYTISRWRSPLVGIKIYGEGIDARVTPLYENRYLDSNGNINNSSTDDYSGNVRKMVLGGKTYFLISTGNKVYFMDTANPHPSSAGNDYSMDNYHTFNISPHLSHGYNNNIYDFDDNGNDEFILWKNEQSSYFQKTKLFIGGMHDNQIKNFWGISWPLGTTINRVLPIRNYSNPQESYVAVKINGSSTYQFYSAFGDTNTEYTEDISLGDNSDADITSFNEKLMFEYDINSYGDIAGIFDNGVGTEYIVTRDSSGKYNFFKCNGVNTFNSPPGFQISGGYYNFKNTNATHYGLKFGLWEIQGGDMNQNGIREFSVAEGSNLKHYEINNTEANLVSEIEFAVSENAHYASKTRQYTFDGKNIWSYRYNSGNNTLKTYKTDTNSGENYFTEMAQDINIYSQGKTSQISIIKNNDINYLHFGDGIYNTTNASPVVAPQKIANISNYSYFLDINKDNNIELIEGGKVYNIDTNFNKNLLYNYDGVVGDFNGDNVLDKMHVYKDSTDSYYKYYPISGVDGSQIFPEISSNSTSCGPPIFSSMRLSTADKDDLIASRSRCGATARLIDPTGNMIDTINHMHTIQMFDIDQDGIKDIFGQDNNYSKYKLQATKLGNGGPSTIFNTTIYDYIQGDIGGPIASVNRSGNGDLHFVVKGLRGEIISVNSSGNILFRSHYYGGEKYEGGEDAIFDNGGVPLDFADVIVGDVNGDDINEIIAAGYDGWVYIIDVNNGDILYKYNIGLSIDYLALGDSDNDNLLSIIISAQDGFIYKLTSSNILGPSWVKDGNQVNVDEEELYDNDKASVNFAEVLGVNGYFVQLYNQTKKSPVFNWVDVGNNTNICIRSDNIEDIDCLSAGIDFTLSSNTVYEWKIQAYDNNVSSPISLSNGFIVTKENNYFSEENDNDALFNFLNNKSDEVSKYRLFGDVPFVLLNSDHSIITGVDTVDISLTPDEYKIFYENKIIVGTGSTLLQVAPNYNCKNILDSGGSKGDGIYSIVIQGGDNFDVYCDMTTDNGGWTLVAKSNTSQNTYEHNNNRASPFIDFYTNEVSELTSVDLEENSAGSVLRYVRRNELISTSKETLIKGIKGTTNYHIYKGKINLGNRLVDDDERLKGRFYWNSTAELYTENDSWQTSLQSGGNTCGWIENINDGLHNDLITAQKIGVNYNQCIENPPVSPIGIGRFIR